MAPIKEQWRVPGTPVRKKNKVTGEVTKHTPEYVVTLYSDDTWGCGCANWTQNHPREDCKHILRKQKELSNGFVAQPATSGIELVGQATGRKFRS